MNDRDGSKASVDDLANPPNVTSVPPLFATVMQICRPLADEILPGSRQFDCCEAFSVRVHVAIGGPVSPFAEETLIGQEYAVCRSKVLRYV